MFLNLGRDKDRLEAGAVVISIQTISMYKHANAYLYVLILHQYTSSS